MADLIRTCPDDLVPWLHAPCAGGGEWLGILGGPRDLRETFGKKTYSTPRVSMDFRQSLGGFPRRKQNRKRISSGTGMTGWCGLWDQFIVNQESWNILGRNVIGMMLGILAELSSLLNYCNRSKSSDHGVACDFCRKWFHVQLVQLTIGASYGHLWTIVCQGQERDQSKLSKPCRQRGNGRDGVARYAGDRTWQCVEMTCFILIKYDGTPFPD